MFIVVRASRLHICQYVQARHLHHNSLCVLNLGSDAQGSK